MDIKYGIDILVVEDMIKKIKEEQGDDVVIANISNISLSSTKSTFNFRVRNNKGELVDYRI